MTIQYNLLSIFYSKTSKYKTCIRNASSTKQMRVDLQRVCESIKSITYSVHATNARTINLIVHTVTKKQRKMKMVS